MALEGRGEGARGIEGCAMRAGVCGGRRRTKRREGIGPERGEG